jgi:hypothetical protein
MNTTYILRNETPGIFTGLAGLVASCVAGIACIGPLMGIALGVSGLGWLTSYSYLTAPASIVSLTLMAVAIVMYRNRKSCCANKRKHLMKRNLLIVSALIVVGINVFEFLIFPNLY